MMLFYERPVNKTQSKEHNQLCMPKFILSAIANKNKFITFALSKPLFRK